MGDVTWVYSFLYGIARVMLPKYVASCMVDRVEAPIIDHLKDSTPYLEKYKVVHFLSCRKLEIRRIANFLVILFLKLKFLWIFEAKSWPKHIYQCLEFAKTTHFNRSFLLTLTQNQDMCHGTIGSGLLQMQSQLDQNSSTL